MGNNALRARRVERNRQGITQRIFIFDYFYPGFYQWNPNQNLKNCQIVPELSAIALYNGTNMIHISVLGRVKRSLSMIKRNAKGLLNLTLAMLITSYTLAENFSNSVLPEGAKVVAGNLQQNEFFILAKGQKAPTRVKKPGPIALANTKKVSI